MARGQLDLTLAAHLLPENSNVCFANATDDQAALLFDQSDVIGVGAHMAAHPILWTFRRCPYAIRARLAVASANLNVELREVVLRDKPDALARIRARKRVAENSMKTKITNRVKRF